ncbi:MAG TPA: hypothetical protein VFB54_11730 [Burkholderiales bacterium]|nr:hypothetical protein [Burkholderiales bacterium]
MNVMPSMRRLHDDAKRHGLMVRAVITANADDGLPPINEGLRARSLVLVGNVGSSLWPVFSASPEFLDGREDPLDRWSRRIGEEMARRWAGVALFPFGGPPHHPFQRWAVRSGALFASPVGLLIDPKYGLWHAFRFAIALPFEIEGRPVSAVSPCLDCRDRPCLAACPVTAFVPGEYRYRDCADHLTMHGDAQCWRIGCLARHACPVGQRYRYLPAQARFHMRAFVAKRHRV